MTDSQYTGVENLEVMKEAVRYNRFLNEIVVAMSDESAIVADFGAGAGTFASHVENFCQKLICIEPDPTLRDCLAEQNLTSIDDSTDLADESFDYVYSLNVLEHIENDAQAVVEIHRILKPGGRLLLYVPAFEVLFSSMDRKVGHFRRYRKGQMTTLVKESGFTVTRASYVDSLGFLAALVYRYVGSDTGEIDRRSLALYDKFIFPLSRVIDKIAGSFAGKNLLVTATKDIR